MSETRSVAEIDASHDRCSSGLRPDAPVAFVVGMRRLTVRSAATLRHLGAYRSVEIIGARDFNLSPPLTMDFVFSEKSLVSTAPNLLPDAANAAPELNPFPCKSLESA